MQVFCCLRVWTDFADFESVDNLLTLTISGDLLFYRVENFDHAKCLGSNYSLTSVIEVSGHSAVKSDAN